MAHSSSDPPARQITLTVALPADLVEHLMELRHALEVAHGGRLSVSRGDVVRIGLTLLWAEYLRSRATTSVERKYALAELQRLRVACEFDSVWPEWLLARLMAPEEVCDGSR